MEKIVQRYVKFTQITIGERFRIKYEKIDDLALSIRDKGIIQPPIVDQNLNLIAGGRRLKAIELLRESDPEKWDEVPVIIRESKDELDAREIELIENLMREDLEWDEQAKLTKRIHNLYQEKNENWTQSDTAGLLERSIGGINESLQLAEGLDKIPELKNAKNADQAKKTLDKLFEKMALDELQKRNKVSAKLGRTDIQLNELLEQADKDYKVIDVFEGLKALPKGIDMIMGNEHLDYPPITLIEVDPPYGVDFIKKKRPAKTADPSQNKDYVEIPAEEYEEFLDKICKELYRVSSKNAKIIFWFGMQWYSQVFESLTSAGFDIDPIPSLWTKKNGQTNQPKLRLARTYETFFYGAKVGNKNIVHKQGRSNQFEFAPTYSGDKYHPTQRPFTLITELIQTFASTGIAKMETILVPFLGSGATLISAKQLGYKCFGFDVNGDYKDKYMYEVRKSYLKAFEFDEKGGVKEKEKE